MDIKDKKWIYGILLVVLVVLIIFLVAMRDESSSYILIDGITKLEYRNEKYEVLTSDRVFLENKMEVYNTFGKVGDFDIQKNDDGFLGYTNLALGNKYIAFLEFEKNEVAIYDKTKLDKKNLEILDDVLEKHKVTKYTTLYQNEQVLYDIDKDGIDETIISVSNYSLNSKDAKHFNFVYIIDNGEIFYLVEKVYDDESFIGNYSIEYLISLNEKKYDIVLYYSDWDSNYHEIYQNQDDIYIKAFEQ